KRVVGDGMTLAQRAAGELRMRERIASQQKERCPRAFALERLENAGGGAGRGPVVEGEHDLLGGEREGVMKMLAADARRRCGLDWQNARRTERFGGAGRWFGSWFAASRGCRERQRKQRERSSHVHSVGHWVDLSRRLRPQRGRVTWCGPASRQATRHRATASRSRTDWWRRAADAGAGRCRRVASRNTWPTPPAHPPPATPKPWRIRSRAP